MFYECGTVLVCAANCLDCLVNGHEKCDHCKAGYGLRPNKTCDGLKVSAFFFDIVIFVVLTFAIAFLQGIFV